MSCKTRAEQYDLFQDMKIKLLFWLRQKKGWTFRDAEAQRPREVAEMWAKKGTGTLDSKHIYSLAFDLWLVDKSGLKILWEDPRYAEIGSKWMEMGGVWGGTFKGKTKGDVYHMEFAEKPIK